ncbi:MAG: DUF1404 family protein [Thermomicrobiales bacterium]|nr:DUF1404 family protein [Thermomicrobiales bacterium]
MSRRNAILLVIGLLLIVAVPPFSWWWEASLVRHMLLQIPLLILAGVLLGAFVAPRPVPGAQSKQTEAAAAVLLAAFCMTFWMLPRWLDAAVGDHGVDAVKIVSLVLLAGVPLGWGWVRLGPVARGFVWFQAISMALVLGWLYAAYPDRLCNSYLVSEQPVLGMAMFGVAAFLGVVGVAIVMIGSGDHTAAAESATAS